MEEIELKSTQSKFCDSNVDTTTVETQKSNACLDIETQSTHTSLTEEEKQDYDTFVNSKDLESFINKTAKLNISNTVLSRVKLLYDQAKKVVNQSWKTKKIFFKRKDYLFTLKSVESFFRIIEKKFHDVNFWLMKYFEYVLLYDSVSELTNDKETLVKLINAIFSLIKFVDSPSDTCLLDYRLQILIKKVLLLNSSDNPNEVTINAALTPLLIKEDIKEQKKMEVRMLIF